MKTSSPVDQDTDAHRRVQSEFLARGEAAWAEYQRTGQSRPASEVFDRVDALIAARRRELTSRPGDDDGDR